MSVLFTNNATSKLLTSIGTSDTSISVVSSGGARFPQPSAADDFFMIVLEDRTQTPVAREIVKCTARNTDTMTIVRAQESTTAQSWNAGIIVSHRITAGTLQLFLGKIPGSTELYLGAFASAPNAGPGGAVLVPGNLYFDTTQNKLFAFNGAFWNAVSAGQTGAGGFGTYLGAFSTAPLTMLDGSALVNGTLYYNPTTPALFEWDGSAWINIQTTGSSNQSNTIEGNTSIDGNLVVSGNETVGGDITCNNITVLDTTRTQTLYLNGDLVVDVGDVSGGSNFQNFPAGTLFQCGTATTASGTSGFTAITFPLPFGSVPIVMVSAHNNTSGFSANWGAVTTNGFNVGNMNGAELSWYAFGAQEL